MVINYKEAFKILFKSFIDATKWKIWKWFLTGSIGALIGTLTVGEKIFHLDADRSIKLGVGFLGVLFVLRFFLIFFKEVLKYFHEVYRNAVYGDAIILLKDGFAHTHAYRKQARHNDKEFMKIMMNFCNFLREIYNKTTDSECSVSIKVPKHDPSVTEQTVLINLTRDTSHHMRNTEKYIGTKHTLIGNTAFTYCLNQVMNNAADKHYVNNSINETKNYESTSKCCYDKGILPYSSELVIPITSIIRDSGKNADCLGFLCVDSNKREAFKSKYDIALLEGVADGIYDLISGRNNLDTPQNSQTNDN